VTGAEHVYRLDLVYEGTGFRGWARQPGQRTVQGEVERALTTALRRRVHVSVAGRTDAGVHALAQVASFAIADPAIAPERLRLTLNALLPADVAVTAVTAAPVGFDARAARARTYRYRLWTSRVRPVHERLHVWNVHGPVDEAALREIAAMLVGVHDFRAFTPSARLYRTCVREVSAAGWRLAGEAPPAAPHDRLASSEPYARELWFEITADSFLHNMVRVAVGSMVDVALGRATMAAFTAGFAGGERRRMGQTAPARGLALIAVDY
jgi:tRNA pseudouridine38-40 synthase